MKIAFSVVILLFEISVIFTVKSEKVIGTLGTKYPPPPARVTHWITDRRTQWVSIIHLYICD